MKDQDVRRAALEALSLQHLGEPDTIIVQEMGIWNGSVRIDIAVINGEMTGIEIKSDRDTLERLPLQAQIYGYVFDKIDLVVGERHLRAAIRRIPDWWGIMRARMTDGEVVIVRERMARANPSRDPLMLARLLWREELIQVLEDHDLARGFKSKGMDTLQARAAEEIPLCTLAASVRRRIKDRTSWLRDLRAG